MSQSDLYTIGEVAAMLGVSAHTVRAWERRHGILDPVRTASRHRRYTPEDIELLREVKQAIELDGVSVRLAFETVTGRQQRVESPLGGTPKPRRSKRGEAADRDMWEAVADALPEFVVVIDEQGKIIQANIAASRLFGMARQRLVGRSFTELVEPFDRAKAELVYHPRPRTATGWELNLTTAHGVRLYRVEVRTVPQAGETLLAVVGTEMFAARSPSEPGAIAEGLAMAEAPATAAVVFQDLLNGLPFGVAVTTIGPDPRVVYANRRLSETVARELPDLTGRRVNELLPHALTYPALRRAASTGETETVRDVSVISRGDAPAHGRSFAVIFQPLFSSARKVASMLVVIEDSAGAIAPARELATWDVDQRFAAAKTPRQLCAAAVDELRNIIPDADFMVAVPGLAEDGQLITMSSDGALPADSRISTGLARAIARAGASGIGVDMPVTGSGRRVVASALPLGPEGTSGGVAWIRQAGAPMPLESRALLNAVVDRLATAAALLGVRAEAARKTSKLQAIVKVATVVRDGGGETGLGTRFLKRLAEMVDADAAAIGRIDGDDFVVEAAYASFGAHAMPGDRFPLAGQYVSESVNTGQATFTETFGSPRLGAPVRQSLSRLRRAISVPLIVDGRVEHVITLLRSADRPFEDGDVLLAQTVSSVALLALSVGDADSGEPAKKVHNR